MRATCRRFGHHRSDIDLVLAQREPVAGSCPDDDICCEPG